MRLTVICNRLVKEEDPKVQQARQRLGKPFGWQRKDFKWESGPTILTNWLRNKEK